MKHDDETLRRTATWAGFSLMSAQLAQLDAFADWLVAEAIPAGAVGPAEAPRMLDRHIADSLAFGVAWADSPPRTLIDFGSGAGLPGIPLAIAYPKAAVTLFDRSQRRIDLAGRAVRILQLPNVVTTSEVLAEYRYDAATFRGSLGPREAVAAARGLLRPGGVAMIGLHRGPGRPAEFDGGAAGESFQIVETPEGILDSTAWLLRMTAA